MEKLSAKEFQKIFSESGKMLNSKGRPIISPHLLDEDVKTPAYATNKKVINAQPVFSADGKKLADSKWEMKCKSAIEEAGLKFSFQKKFELIPTIRKKSIGKTLSKRSWSPDFVFNDIKIVADAKGHITEMAKIKIQLFCFLYQEYDVYLLRNKTDLYNFINIIKQKKDE